MRTLFSFECPGKDLERYDQWNDYYFVLPLLLKDPIYFELMKETRKFKCLDNGVYESGIPEVDNLLLMARMIGADEVVIPDYMNNRERTKEVISSFLDSLSKDEWKEFKWMIVPHDTTITGWMNAYTEFDELFGSKVYSIGVPKSLTYGYPQGIWNRVVAMQMLRALGRFIDKPHHLLGLRDPCEIKFMPFLRSVDTSWPFKVEGYRRIADKMKLLRGIFD